MDSFDFFKSIFTVFAVFAGLFAWLFGPIAITMVIIYVYTGNAILGVFLGVIVEVIAIMVGFKFVDVI
jgi:hypothetical protein